MLCTTDLANNDTSFSQMKSAPLFDTYLPLHGLIAKLTILGLLSKKKIKFAPLRRSLRSKKMVLLKMRLWSHFQTLCSSPFC